MNKPTDFGEIVIIETDDYDKFSRKKLIKVYNKFNNIRNAFKNNKFYINSGFDSKNVLTNQEIKLIHQEIDTEAYKYESRDKSRDALLKYYVNELTDCVESMKELIDSLPEEIKSTYFECQCGSKVVISHKARHLKSPTHLKKIENKVVEIPQKPKAETTLECGCGKTFSIKNKTHHNKTQYHLDWINICNEIQKT